MFEYAWCLDNVDLDDFDLFSEIKSFLKIKMKILLLKRINMSHIFENIEIKLLKNKQQSINICKGYTFACTKVVGNI